MNGEQILKGRTSRNWEQLETAARLKVSQPYLSLIETGKRPVTEILARRAIRLFKLPPTALPLQDVSELTTSKSEKSLASQLAGIGYPKFAHLTKTKKVNPAIILISALKVDDLESRIVEALPWLIYRFSDMDWSKVIKTVKISDSQNRLGFLLSLVFDKAKKANDQDKRNLLKELLSSLERSKLYQEDSFQRQKLTESEKIWLKKNRLKNAKIWRVLSNLTAEHLTF